MAAITSNGTGGGLWSLGATWVGGVAPASGDTVTVAATDTITFDQNDTGANTCLSIALSGIINFSNTMTTQMTLGSSGLATCLTFAASTAELNMGISATPIPSLYTCTLKVDTSAENGAAVLYSNVLAKWRMFGTPTYNATSTTIDTYATGTYNTTLASIGSPAATTIVLTDDLGLRAGGGDFIAIWEADSTAVTANQSSQTRTEYFTTSSYNAGTKTVTLPSGLVNTHQAGGRVVNMTRNVIFKGTSTSRRPGVSAAGLTGSTGSPPGMDWRHCQLFEIGNISSANNAGAAFASIKMIGVSTYITTTKEIGSVFAMTNVNNHFVNLGIADSGRVLGANFSMSYCTSAGVTNRSILQGGTISNCNFGPGFIPLSSLAGVTLASCTFEESLYGVNGASTTVFNSCTFKNLSNAVSSSINCIMNSCSTTNVGNIIDTGNRDVIIRGGNMAFTSADSGNTNDLRQPYPRYLRRQETTQGTYTVYDTGTITRYTISDVPDAIFPVPSGATYTQRLVPRSNIQYMPVNVDFIIPATAGQSFTFTVPIMPRFTFAFTTADVYLSIAQPGTTSVVTSVQTLGASGSWAFLSATGTAVTAGPMVCSVVFKNNGGNYYIDFPLGMASSGYVWIDGAMNENFVPLSGTPAADVWNYPTASITATGITGKLLKDIDGNAELAAVK
jgi:hypothetical protein